MNRIENERPLSSDARHDSQARVNDEACTIVIAGASGFIGQALLSALLQKFPNAKITALSRAAQESNDVRVQWKACDLFSLKALEEAMPERVDLAYYLVHSMGPTAALDQGSFADYDLLLADNFVRALSSHKPKQLIYLGGLIPHRAELSLHLASRLEVEQTFTSGPIPTTIFRAALIVGEAGSSFQIMKKLVARLPVLLCPRWTQNLTTPVDIATVVEALCDAGLEARTCGQIYDLASCEPLTYMDMMKETARAMGKRRFFFTFPFFSPFLSRYWVSVVTGASKTLVYPLIASLRHEMVARPEHLYRAVPAGQTYRELVRGFDFRDPQTIARSKFRYQRKSVRSVQRLPLPHGRDAAWVRREYERWLPEFMHPFLTVGKEGDDVVFRFLPWPRALLDLQYSPERSNPDRQLLYIRGGVLTGTGSKGRLEFRVALDRRAVIAAIHEFRPALPWWIYCRTQAVVHAWVMHSFAKHLCELDPSASSRASLPSFGMRNS